MKTKTMKLLCAMALAVVAGMPRASVAAGNACRGANIRLAIQVENELKWGLDEFGAASGWAIVMGAKTGAIYAMASYPDCYRIKHERS